MIGILNYGTGNIKSVQNTLDRLGQKYFVSDKPETLKTATKIIFPGVGHAKFAMEVLKTKKLDDFLKNYEKPVLGICLGMQLLLDFSEEGNTNCLGIIPGKTEKFDPKKVPKIPHMGWNNIIQSNEETSENYFYFIHSYFVPLSKFTKAKSQFNNQKFSAIIQYKNFTGMQFHPEKSGKLGETVLSNFLDN